MPVSDKDFGANIPVSRHNRRQGWYEYYWTNGFKLKFTDRKKFTLWYMHEDQDFMRGNIVIGVFCTIAIIFSFYYYPWQDDKFLGGHYEIVTEPVRKSFKMMWKMVKNPMGGMSGGGMHDFNYNDL